MEEEQLYDRIGETDFNPTYVDGQTFLHTDVNKIVSVTKEGVNENYYDIQRMQNGTKSVGNAMQIDGATLSRYIDEPLQANDNKVPSSQQTKEYIDGLFADYSAPIRGVDYWTEDDKQEIIDETSEGVESEIDGILEDYAKLTDIPSDISSFNNDREYVTADDLQTALGAKANQSDLNTTNQNVSNVNTKVEKKPYYYGTLSALKNDLSLKAGDCAITLGYYEPNDGGAGTYEIVEDDLIDDGGLIHELDNELFAKLITKNYVTPEMFGAYGDGIHDDILALKKAINTGLTVKTTKTYLISEELPIKQSFIMENNSMIKCSSAVTGIGVSITKDRQRNANTYLLNVDGGGYQTVATVAIGKPRKSIIIINVINAGAVGIDCDYYPGNGNGGNQFTFHVIGNSNGTTEKGVIANCVDSIFHSIVTQDCQYGVYIDKGELIANYVHAWISNSLAPTLWNNSYAIYDRSYFNMQIGWLYQDSVRYGVGGTAPYGHINYFEFHNTLTDASTLYNNEINVYSTLGPTRLTIDNYRNTKTEAKRLTYSLSSSTQHEFGVLNKNGVDSAPSTVQQYKPFTDCNNAPQWGSFSVPYDTTNLPVEQGGSLVCSVIGSNVIQEFYSNNFVGTYYKRFRKLSESTWTNWYRYNAVS